MPKYTISVEVTDSEVTPELFHWLLEGLCTTVEILPEGSK
jgi:hypothetical protein